MLFPQYSLCALTKSPELGLVKTRLQPAFPAEFSLALHTRLVDFVLAQWRAAAVCPLRLYLSGSHEQFFRHLPQWQTLAACSQQGKGLGDRLYNVLLREFEAVAGVFLVGTDCPFIDKPYLMEACQALQNNDVVIGPASDGGYVLLGLKRAIPALFADISWGGPQVFEQTMESIHQCGLSHYQLPMLSDIDRPEDVNLLRSIEHFRNAIWC